MADTRPVLRIFISSTAIDLRPYRDRVRDAVLRLKTLPIAMETFSAQGGEPAGDCMKMAADADAVVCIVAHRYGYVPPVDLGGDGERSITWLEVDAAKRAGKPVFAFLVDPVAPWSEVKEQDRLISEREKAVDILKSIDKLQEFKAWIDKNCTRQLFTSLDDLDAKVTAALASYTPQPSHAPIATARIWRPLICHALQPAQHFRGRAAKLQELKDWLESPVTPDRVISVVAAGGTGKTALVNKALHEARLSSRAGVFVWSFYEDSHTDAFLRAAYLYFTGDKDTPAGGLLDRLQLALSGDTPHVLVLDGLERVQSEGDHRRRGELEDLQLKRFLRALAGGIGATRALVTSRFPLVDLDDWKGAGHRAIVLDDLERPAALDVLRAWGVAGDDDALTKLIEPLNMSGSYHALSVAVLGSYLGNFAGQPAPEFSFEDAKETDPRARRLQRILEQYTAALTGQERDLLARLSVFPRGVKVELLGWIVQSGGEIAGALIGLSELQLMRQLDRLKALGLVFRYDTDGQIVYSAHPFLREFFRNLLGTKPESVHESVRARLAPSLEAKPDKKPRDTFLLDQYELLIEETLLSDRIQEAFDLYCFGLGGYDNLGWVLGESTRGLRILGRFLPLEVLSPINRRLSARDQSVLINAFGGFAMDLGDLSSARDAFLRALVLDRTASDSQEASTRTRNLALLELRAAHFPGALRYADDAVSFASKVVGGPGSERSLSFRAASHLGLGDLSACDADLKSAADIGGGTATGYYGMFEAEGKSRRGDTTGARRQTEANLIGGAAEDSNHIVCACDALLARLVLPDNPARAAKHLQDARAFANRSGIVELQLRCFHAAAELHRHLGDHPQSIAEAEAGILLADTCGFGLFSIDLRIALAETLLDAAEPRKALQNARAALDRSEAPECQYAWGKADGLHFCGIAHMRLGERELARQRLTAALEIREKLTHGRLEETRKALAQVTAS